MAYLHSECFLMRFALNRIELLKERAFAKKNGVGPKYGELERVVKVDSVFLVCENRLKHVGITQPCIHSLMYKLPDCNGNCTPNRLDEQEETT